jgi:hypothetical protein
MLVTGSKTPSGYLKQMHLHRTDDVSPLIEQDVLLLGGTEDFCIPLHQFHDQLRSLTSARSVTARLFARQEQGAGAAHHGRGIPRRVRDEPARGASTLPGDRL